LVVCGGGNLGLLAADDARPRTPTECAERGCPVDRDPARVCVGPLLALACACGARLYLKQAFLDDISR
jgi:hypothetical protein